MDESRFNRLESKIDKLGEDSSQTRASLASINATLKAQHEQLKIHIKRTELLEKDLAQHKKEDLAIHAPIQEHMTLVKGAVKWFSRSLVILGSITGLIIAFKKLLH